MAGKGRGKGGACGGTAGAATMVSEPSVLDFGCSARCRDPSPSASNLRPSAVIPDQLPQRHTWGGTDPFFSGIKTSATQYFNDFGCTSSVRQNFLIVAEGDALAEQGSNGFDEFPSLSLDERMGQLRFNREIMVRLELQDKKQAIFDSKMDELLDQISFLVSSVQKLKKSQGGVYQEDPISENSEGQPGEFLNKVERAVVFGNDERNSHLGNGRRSTDCKLSSSLLTSLGCLTNVCEKSSKKSQLFLCEKESVVSDPPRARQKSELKNKLSPIKFVDQNFLESNLEISVGVVIELMSGKGEKLMSLYNGFSVRTLTDKQGQEGDDVEVVKLQPNAQPPPEPPPTLLAL